MVVNKSCLIITDDFKHLSLLSLQRRRNQHCRLNGVNVDDAVLLQNRKFRLICSILVSNVSLVLTKKTSTHTLCFCPQITKLLGVQSDHAMALTLVLSAIVS